MDTAVSEKTLTHTTSKPGTKGRFVALCLLFAATFLFVTEAHALLIDSGALNFSCAGGVITDSSIAAACDADPDSLSARVICEYEATLAQVMQAVQCKVSAAVNGPVTAALVLYIVLLGIGFLTGMVRLTQKDVMVAVIKVALITGFVWGGSFAYDYGFSVFTGFARQGTKMMMDVVNTPPDPNSKCVVTGPNGETLSKEEALYKVTDKKALDWVDKTDEDNNEALGTLADPGAPCLPDALGLMEKKCANFILVIVFLGALALPFLSVIFGYALIKYVELFARAVLGYLSAIFLLTFLFLLAPLFLSFGLFNRTRDMFDKWLGSMISFSLQIVIVFAFFAFANLFGIMPFLKSLAVLVKPKPLEGMWGVLSKFTPINPIPCSLCEFTRDASGNLLFQLFPAGDPKAIMAPYCKDIKSVMPFSAIIQQGDFLTWVLIKFIGIIVIVSVLEDFLNKAPELARNLSAVRYAAIIGGEAGEGIKFKGFKALSTGIAAYREKARTSKSGWLIGNAFGTNLGALDAGVDAFLWGQKDPQQEAKIEQMKKQKEELRDKLKEAKKKAIELRDAVNNASPAAKEALQRQLDQAEQNEQTQARAMRGLEGAIDTARNDETVLSGGLKQEIDDVAEIDELAAMGKKVERRDRVAQQWYNLLSTGTAYSESAESEQYEEIKELRQAAASTIELITSSKSYGELKPGDRKEVDRALDDLQRTADSNDPEAIMRARSQAVYVARSKGVRW